MYRGNSLTSGGIAWSSKHSRQLYIHIYIEKRKNSGSPAQLYLMSRTHETVVHAVPKTGSDVLREEIAYFTTLIDQTIILTSRR